MFYLKIQLKMNKEHAIMFVVVVLAVLAAGFIGKKMGLSSYDEYESLEDVA